MCYCCAGITNPLINPRYQWGKLFAGVFYRKWVGALADADLILAAADTKAIDTLVAGSDGKLRRDSIVHFPTRVDTSVFRPMSKTAGRKALGFEGCKPLLINCGRLNRVKGWKLILDSFVILSQSLGDARLVFVGDGEDRTKIERYASNLGLSDSVTVTGFLPPKDVARYLNAADVCVVGSHHEGWSVAMLEALACGKPIVSTDVSGASGMVHDGENGFVVPVRDSKISADAITAAMKLETSKEHSVAIAERYAIKNLARDLAAIWKPLS